MSMRCTTLALLGFALALSAPASAETRSIGNSEAWNAVLWAGKYAEVVRHLHDVPSVGIERMNLGSAAPGRNEKGDIQIVAGENGGVWELRHALSANPVTRHALEAHGVDVSDVLGVQVGASGSLRLFTN